MRWLGWRKRGGEESLDEEQAGEQPAVEVWSGGPSTGARANGAALMRVLVWGLVTAGPVLGLVALHRAGGPAAEVRVPEVPVEVAAGDTGAAGFAEMFVAAYLETDSASAGDVLAVYYPGAAGEPLRSASGEPGRAERVAAVGSEEVSDNYWSVTVAALVAEASEGEALAGSGLRYFRVAVAEGRDGWVAAAWPSEIAAPTARGSVVELGYTPVTLPDGDPAVATVEQFLGAFLAGGGDVSRYLSPDAGLLPVSPAPYAAVRVTSVEVRGEAPRHGEVLPMVAGGRVQLLVTADAQAAGGATRPLTYALVLAERDGRWEVAALEAAPGLPDETAREDGAR